ncbi:LOW QUALITY PROTEIN: hypothetical protein YC2023_120927 [Brassica napus]
MDSLQKEVQKDLDRSSSHFEDLSDLRTLRQFYHSVWSQISATINHNSTSPIFSTIFLTYRPQTAGARWPNYRGPEERGPHDSSRGVSPRHSSDKSSGFEENRRRYDDRSIHRSRTPIYSRKSPSNRSLQERDTPRLSERGGEPHTKNSKEDKSSPSIEASSNSKRSPPKELALVRRSSLASRLSDPLTQKSTSGERVPAKERLSVHTQRTSTPDLRDSLSGSKRRHEDGEIHMEENVLPAEGKKKLTKPQDRKRVARSPVQGVSLKKRRVTKSKESPRRKLMMDAIVAGGRGLSGVSRCSPVVTKVLSL